MLQAAKIIGADWICKERPKWMPTDKRGRDARVRATLQAVSTTMRGAHHSDIVCTAADAHVRLVASEEGQYRLVLNFGQRVEYCIACKTP